MRIRRVSTKIGLGYLLLIVVNSAVAGGLFYFWFNRTLHTSEQYLNWGIAQEMAQEVEQLLAREGGDESIQELFARYVVINPRLDPFLLNKDGEVEVSLHLTHEVAAIELAPIREFLAHNGFPTKPILSQNPAYLSWPGKKIPFSAARLISSGEEKFLFVNLNSARGVLALSSVGDPNSLKAIASVFLAAISLALLLGVAVYKYFSKRLVDIAETLAKFSSGDYSARIATSGEDEVGELATTVNAMATKLQASIAALAKADSSRRELLSNLSHDMRHPAAVMRTALEAMRLRTAEQDPAVRSAYLDKTVRASIKLSSYIDDLFELATLSDPVFKLVQEPCVLTELLDGVAIEYSGLSKENQQEFVLEIPSEPIRVVADAERIERVLSNLLVNAFTHTPPGGRIVLRTYTEAGKAIICVQNSGPKIPPEAVPELFERFYTGANSPLGKGTGLGLSIVKQIIDLHHSEITVESEDEQGTTFSFWLLLA